jgi:hypothetical protein
MLFNSVTSGVLTGNSRLGYSGQMIGDLNWGVSFTGVDRFDLKLGGSNDDIYNGAGADSFDGGNGIDLMRYSGN